MPTLTQQQIDQLRELFEKTTQGEWTLVGGDYAYTGLDYAFDPQESGDAVAEQARRNERWAVAIHNAFPALLETLAEKDRLATRVYGTIRGDVREQVADIITFHNPARA